MKPVEAEPQISFLRASAARGANFKRQLTARFLTLFIRKTCDYTHTTASRFRAIGPRQKEWIEVNCAHDCSSHMDQTTRKGTAAASPQSAARYVRRGSAAMQAVGIRNSVRRTERLALVQWAKERRLILDTRFIEQFRQVAEGAEHIVYHDEKRALAMKATRPNCFGHSARNEGLAATPLEYLQRLGWHNALFGDDIRIEGITFVEENIEVITSQPWIVSDGKHPALQAEIDSYFEHLGFRRVEINPGVPIYFNERMNVIVADAHDRNILRTEEGILAPIDVVIGIPNPDLLERIHRIIAAQIP